MVPLRGLPLVLSVLNMSKKRKAEQGAAPSRHSAGAPEGARRGTLSRVVWGTPRAKAACLWVSFDVSQNYETKHASLA